MVIWRQPTPKKLLWSLKLLKVLQLFVMFFFLLNVLDDVFLKCKNCHKVLINVLFPPASGFNFDVLNPLVVPVWVNWITKVLLLERPFLSNQSLPLLIQWIIYIYILIQWIIYIYIHMYMFNIDQDAVSTYVISKASFPNLSHQLCAYWGGELRRGLCTNPGWTPRELPNLKSTWTFPSKLTLF